MKAKCGCAGLALFASMLVLSQWSGAQQPAPTQAQAPLTLTLQDALSHARSNSVQFQSALTDAGIASQDKVQARAALLPSVTFNNGYIYSEGTGTTQITGSNQPAGVAAPKFIASNAVHEYLSQAQVQETLGYGQVADYRRTKALEAAARAKAEIASRGLVVTVVQNYYGLISSQRKYANVQEAAAEAQRFLDLSRKLEAGGEVAHADVIKAQIQSNDRQRDLREAQLTMEKARLELAVLLFPDFNQNFSIVDDTQLAPPLQSFDEFTHLAQAGNPDVRAATASFQAAGHEMAANQAGYFPTLTVSYLYGIDAPNFAVNSPEGFRNLGSGASATLNIPVWNWGATRSKVVQADLRRKQAQRELSQAQRKLQADTRALYSEAQAALSELELLKNSTDLAAESLRLTNLRYQGGEATVLEVVDAQNTLTQARNGYSDGVVRYRTALANLQTLTGTM